MVRPRFVPLVPSLVLLFCACAALGEETDKARDEAAKAFGSLYGADFKRVQTTRERTDDIDMAKRLLVVARDAAAQPEFMAILCEKADELASVSPDGYDTAVEAMELLAGKSPERAAACSERIVEIRQKHFDVARGDDRSQAGEALVDALLSLMDAKAAAGATAEAVVPCRRAATVARTVNSPRKDQIAARLKALEQAALEAVEIENLTKQLAREPQNRAVRERLVRRLLVDLDNPAEAATHIEGLEDASLLKYLPAAAKPLEEAPELACLELAEWYRGLGETASPGAKAAMFARAQAYYKRFLELHLSQDLERTRASIAIKKIEEQLAASGGTPNSVAVARLEGPLLGKALLSGLQRTLATSRRARRPRLLQATEHLVGTVEWTADKGEVLRPAGKIVIGTEAPEGRGPPGTVNVAPGLFLEGGEVFVEHGDLHLRGAVGQPVILKGVDLSAGVGQVDAQYAIFIDCKFRKAGGRLSERYTSKWIFRNCVIAGSNFDSFKQVDYGIKATHSVFLKCAMPKRLLERKSWANPQPTETGIAQLYQDEWNDVRNCHFVDCVVAPSFVWATKTCDFTNCQVQGMDSFVSTDSLRVQLYVAPKERGLLEQLIRQSLAMGTGKVVFENSPAPFAAGLPWTTELVGREK